MIKVILQKFNIDQLKIIRAKANLQTSNVKIKNNKHSSPHVDMNENHFVILYYVNNSQGETFLFKKNKIWKKINPKQGRVLIFNGNIKHAAGYPVDNQIRVVKNININSLSDKIKVIKRPHTSTTTNNNGSSRSPRNSWLPRNHADTKAKKRPHPTDDTNATASSTIPKHKKKIRNKTL